MNRNRGAERTAQAAERHFFAGCARGLEELVLAELQAAGIADVRATAGGVEFGGSLEHAYRACLWSSVASRILFVLGDVDGRDADVLYAAVTQMAWESHFPPGATLAVDFIGTSDAVRNTLFGARRVKDAIVDRLRAVRGTRPDVNLDAPDLRIVARLHREIAARPGDEELARLLARVLAQPDVPSEWRIPAPGLLAAPFLTVHLRSPLLEVRLFTMLTSIGTPLDVTAEEIHIESYFPADDATEAVLRAL